MYRCLNLGTLGISADWKACLTMAKEGGFEGIDIPITAQLDIQECKDLLVKFDLRPGGVNLQFDFLSETSAFNDGLKLLAEVAGRAKEIGEPRFYAHICSFSDDRPWKENFRFHTERLGLVTQILAEYGCVLGLGLLGPTTLRQGHRYGFIHTLEQLLDLCDEVGRGTGVMLDAWHWYASLGTVADILGLAANQVIGAQVSDAPTGIPVEMLADEVRVPPGESGTINLAGFLIALRRIRYDGPVVPHCRLSESSTIGPAEAIRRAGDALRRVWHLPSRPLLPRTMKAVATGRRKAWIVDLPVPRAQGNEVVIKLHASPICGSVMSGYFGDGELINQGHEGAGEVVEVAHSTRLKVGDRVVTGVLNGCGRCPDCLRGDAIFCKERPGVHGTFAQFTRTSDAVCTRIPDSLSYAHASLMCCGLGPAYEAIKRLRVRPYDTILISGLGPVGLGATVLAATQGAKVIALDPVSYRRDLARKLGAATALDPADAAIRETLLTLTEGRGMSRSIEASGNGLMERMIIDLADIRGEIAFVGENQGTIAVSPSRDLIRKGLTLHGCWHMNVLDSGDLIRFLLRWPAKADMLITRSYEFAHVQAAFDTFASKECAKVLLLPWE